MVFYTIPIMCDIFVLYNINFIMERLSKYSFTKSQKSLVIEALKWDCIRQIDQCSFGVTFCKPRLKLLAELTKDDSHIFFWSKYQFGCVYRSLVRLFRSSSFDYKDFPLYLLIKGLCPSFITLYPFQTKFIVK